MYPCSCFSCVPDAVAGPLDKHTAVADTKQLGGVPLPHLARTISQDAKCPKSRQASSKPYYTILYYTIQYCTMLYCTIFKPAPLPFRMGTPKRKPSSALGIPQNPKKG